MPKYRRKRNLPPAVRIPSDAQGIARIEYYKVGSWSDRPAAENAAPSAVMLEIKPVGATAMGMRFRSPAAVDELIEALLRHRADVWPDAGPAPGSGA